MILTEISDYLEQRGELALCELARHFRTSEDAMQGMLAIWQRRGRVELTERQCGGGCSCPSSREIRVRWLAVERIAVSQR